MPLDNFFDLRVVGEQRVFVVDDHHKALAAWALVRRELAHAPDLITIDHHTDTHEAFLRHAFHETGGDPAAAAAMREALKGTIDWASVKASRARYQT